MLFLRRHGWTWRDLQETPADVVDLMRLIDAEEAAMSRKTRRHRG